MRQTITSHEKGTTRLKVYFFGKSMHRIGHKSGCVKIGGGILNAPRSIVFWQALLRTRRRGKRTKAGAYKTRGSEFVFASFAARSAPAGWLPPLQAHPITPQHASLLVTGDCARRDSIMRPFFILSEPQTIELLFRERNPSFTAIDSSIGSHM